MPRARTCNRAGCDAELVFAVREDTGRKVPYEAEAVDIDRLSSVAGLHVLVNGAAWKPERLAEHYRVVFELPSLDQARDLVRQYPHHRPHFDLPAEGDTPR